MKKFFIFLFLCVTLSQNIAQNRVLCFCIIAFALSMFYANFSHFVYSESVLLLHCIVFWEKLEEKMNARARSTLHSIKVTSLSSTSASSRPVFHFFQKWTFFMIFLIFLCCWKVECKILMKLNWVAYFKFWKTMFWNNWKRKRLISKNKEKSYFNSYKHRIFLQILKLCFVIMKHHG